MADEQTTRENSNEVLPNSRRLQIRRGILRQTSTIRSAPYNSTFSHLRRRQNSHILNYNYQEQIDNENEDFQVLLDLSHSSPPTTTDSTNIHNNHSTNLEQNQSYHSLVPIDFDSDIDDDDDDGRYYYTSASIPVFDYSSSTSSIEPGLIPIEITQEQINQSNDDDEDDEEDLSIEILLETSSENNSFSPIPQRRRSIIPANNRGLRLADVLSIPQKLYSSLKEQTNDKYHPTTTPSINTQCYICLEDFQSTDSIKTLNCQHIFHSECINQWLRHHSNCAYCRTAILIDFFRSTTTRHRQRTRTRRIRTNPRSSTTTTSSAQIANESSTFEEHL